MHPILFKIGAVNFYTHGILAVFGIFIGVAIIYYFANKEELDSSLLVDNIIFTVLFGIVGARAAYYLLYSNQFSNLQQIIYLWDGGLVSYGGFILGGIALCLLLKIQRQPVLEWLDIFSIGFPAGLFFGRIGDLFAGDYAYAYKLVSASSLTSFVPTPLYEALLCFLIFVVLILSYFKSRGRLSPGQLFVELTLLYSTGRFIIDFWRDDKPLIAGLSTSQIMDLVFFVSALVIFIYSLLNRRRKGNSDEFIG